VIFIFVIAGLVFMGLVVLACLSIRVVREYQRIVVFKLGRASGAKGPGLTIINPITDRLAWVDLRE
jgi:regulator of protease activity HflC (stomatin/prohibitin superfamily)